MKSILLADSGSTKTIWSLLREGETSPLRLNTEGLNPLHGTEADFLPIIQKVRKEWEDYDILEIHFFGAGCIPEVSQTIKFPLEHYFGNIPIEVRSDMEEAAIALFGENEGIACILGTGSNSCFYSNGKILDQIPSLGYILGDEGSGVALGKSLLNAVFKRKLSEKLISKFKETYSTNLPDLIQKVYRQPKPATYIASFSPFILKNLNDKEIYELVSDQFELFFRNNVMQYEGYKDKKIGFVGSVAYHYRDLVKKVGEKLGIYIHNIIPDPLIALEKYYALR